MIAVGVDGDSFLDRLAVLPNGAKQRKWIPELDGRIACDQFLQGRHMGRATGQQFVSFAHESCLT